ncbi:three-helix bundle dimerization domain-containing protein [Lysinimonas soli]|uniref:Three-helix bundle dimerization domain-containing protein n=1 Tax=Lysinimonas soli TaxID=1074233 RepID=A0ABW0NL35_9MICO
MTTDIDTDEIFRQVTARLRDKFPEVHPQEVESAVRGELDQLADRPVRDYLEVLTERAAAKRLKGVSQAA